jgi:hypothetical protein
MVDPSYTASHRVPREAPANKPSVFKKIEMTVEVEIAESWLSW